MKIISITFAALTLASLASADLFDDAAKNFQDSASTAVEQAKEDVDESKTGALEESVTKAQEGLAEATATQQLVAKAVDTSKQLESTLADNPELQSLLTNSMTSLAQGQDFVALKDLSALTEAKLTPEQMNLAKELRTDVEVLALKRKMPQSGPVTSATEALQSGDYTKASTQLSQLLQSGTLNEPQKALVQTILGNHKAAVAQ